MFALADCNNFFASCERVFRPELNGRPVIVLSNNDGCAVARSEEAKALGIKMGDPLFKIRDIVEKNDVSVFSSNFPLYGDMSRRVQEVLAMFSPVVQQYSIDEAFMDLEGLRVDDFGTYARKISATCLKYTAIPVSVGVAPTKTLAKIASKLCKRYPKLQGGCYMYRPQDIEKVLRNFPVQDVWGIGRRSFRKLEVMGVRTAWDYTRLPGDAVRDMFALPGYRTWQELRGIPCIEFEDIVAPRQSICVSRSFAKEIKDVEELCTQVANFAAAVCDKLRKQDSMAAEMVVFAMTNRFKDNLPQTSAGICVPFADPSDDHASIIMAAVQACRRLFNSSYAYKKAGVVITKVVSRASYTPSLFADASGSDKASRLSATIDEIKRHYGDAGIMFGIQGDGSVKSSREHQSPHYTTLWSDIPAVKVE